MKILFLTNVPSPYRVLFFQELGKCVDLTVLYETGEATDRNHDWVAELQENKTYTEIYLRAWRKGVDTAFCPEVAKYLKRDYDRIIIGGYSTPTGRFAISYLKSHGIPYWLNCDGGFVREESGLKRLIKKHYISGAAGYLCSGKSVDEYLIHYGAMEERIHHYEFTSVKAKDVLASPITSNEKQALREKYLPQFQGKKAVIIMVGQLIQRKGIDVLLEAARELPKTVGICIIGGQPTDEYLQYVNEYDLNQVCFVPFQKADILRKYYQAADLFVLPTREDIWGLVVNEAMANGLPVITTDRCIAGLELVRDGVNGKIIPTDDSQSLANAIGDYLRLDEAEKQNWQKSAIEKISDYTIEQMARTHQEILSQKNILMVGSRVPEEILLKSKTVSPAANRFQEKLVKNLRQQGADINELAYIAEPLENVSNTICKKRGGVFGTIQAILRTKKAIRSRLKNCDMALCYNMIYAWLYLPKLAKNMRKKSILILADYSGEECYASILKKIYARLQLRSIRRFDAVVGLSPKLEKYTTNHQKFMLMEGGIDPDIFEYYEDANTDNARKGEIQKLVCVYSGLLNHVAGIPMLLEAMKHTKADFDLWITGRGEDEDLVRKAEQLDSRIHYLGLLKEDEYLEVLKKADILLNPRNMNLLENQDNFPSKIMDYLATGNSILSTRFAGFEKFEDYIIFCDNNAEDYASSLEELLENLHDKRADIAKRREFASQFLWNKQAKRILEL